MTKTLGAYVTQAFKGSRKTILQSSFFRSSVWQDVLPIRKARYLAARNQVVIQWRRFQSFFADPARALNSDERILWEREALVALATRTGWWLLIVLIGSLAALACVFFAYSNRGEKPDSVDDALALVCGDLGTKCTLFFFEISFTNFDKLHTI